MEYYSTMGLPRWSVVKNPPDNAGDAKDEGSISGSGRSSGGGNGNPLQSSCLENFMDRGSWRLTVHVVAKSWTLSEHTHIYTALPNHKKDKISHLTLMVLC